MRAQRHHWRQPPPWWPSGESWPPVSRAHVWRRGKGRFIRRMAVGFAAMLILSLIGLASLISLLGGAGTPPWPGRALPVAILAATAIVFTLLLAIVRRVGIPFGDI